jgi:hypothetical protein
MTFVNPIEEFPKYRELMAPYSIGLTVWNRDENEDYSNSYTIIGQKYNDLSKGIIFGQPCTFSLYSDSETQVKVTVGDRITDGTANYQVLEVTFFWGNLLAVCQTILERATL